MGGAVTAGAARSPFGRLARLPFLGETWRRTLYAVVSPLVGLCCLLVAVVGGHRAAARTQRRLAGRLLGVPPDADRPAPAWPRVVGHGLLGLPLNALAFAVGGYGWAVVALNVAYPARLLLGEDLDGLLDGAWGGPTLAGAWLLHGLAGLVLLWVVPLLVGGVTRVQGLLARAML
ncbi:hypothetical protein [Actinorugispora endophytica]|uniref:Sensor protein n=1 Tax=Actinorugispora endophytica TaxID=1605990 RepID=A0A4R6UXL8_9ACTN|nr:hypothetical protein [Actinorugispora endophytica]TDQ52179.1 hypothetical protein EV190_1079 [Actinorugispora endophytica]